MAIELAPGWSIPDSEVSVRHARSSGPGGQNVNKVSTKVELRFHFAASQSLDSAQKRRLQRTFPSHVTQGGELVVSSDRFRSQHRNHQDALERLVQILLSIRRGPKRRVATKPTTASKERRLSAKRRQSERKRERQSGT